MSSSERQRECLKQQWIDRWSPLFRTIWLLLFLVHLVPIYVVSQRFLKSPSLGNVVSLLVLFVIVTLSALKTLDVACLRIPLNRRSIMGLILIALWVHGDVVVQKLPEYITEETSITLTPVVMAAMRRRLVLWFTHLAAFLLQLKQQCYYIVDSLKASTTPLVLLCHVPPRAPPRR